MPACEPGDVPKRPAAGSAAQRDRSPLGPGPLPGHPLYGRPMAVPTRFTLAVLAVLTLAGCATAPAHAPAHPPVASTHTGSPPVTTPGSAFCLDLTVFQLAVVEYKATVGKAIDGQPLDFDELRRQATIITNTGAEMRASAPADISAQFATVLAGVATSVAALKPGATVRDVVEPVYGPANEPAFDAVDAYRCR